MINWIEKYQTGEKLWKKEASYEPETDTYEAKYSLPEVRVAAPNLTVAKAVREERDKFGKDFVFPAIKAVGSLTPIGAIIGFGDAYKAQQEGNTGWAIAGAGLEALPYAGKVVAKTAPIVKTVAKNLKKDNLRILIYNNISPASYTGKKQEIKNLIRDIKYIDNPTIHNNPIRETIVPGPHSNDFYGLDPQVANRNRNDAWKLYLGIDDKGKSLYIPTNKKDVYRYNPSRISDEAEHNFLNQDFDQGYDFLTSNAGGVGRIKTIPSNLPDVQFAKMRDTWDLQPFKEANRSLLSDLPFADKFIFNYTPIVDYREYKKWVPDKLKNLEIGEFLGVGKPFTVEHSTPYTSKIDFVSNVYKMGNKEYLNLKPLVKNKKVTDRIVYEKPDYSELMKDINNKKFDKTFQKGGTIKEPTLHTFKLGGEIKSYDNSLNRNIDRFIGKVKSKVPENLWVLPGMSDIDDVLYLKQAFSGQGNTLDKIIATVGLSFPYVSTKALKALPIAKRNFPYKQVQETSEELQKRGAPAAYAYAVAEGNWDKPLISVGDNTFYRGVHLPVVPGGKYADDRLTTPLRPSDVDISSQGFRKMEEYAIDPDLPRLQGIDEQNIASGNYYHNGLWTSGTKSIADQYAKVGRFKVNYNQWADKIFKDPNSTKVVYRETPKDIGNLPVGIVQNFKPSKTSLVGIDANDNVRNMISKFYGKPASEISLQEGRDFLNRARIDFTRFNRPFEDGYHFLPGRITPTNNKFIYDQGGIIPKAQEGRKVKKSVIFAESPKIEGGQPQYYIYDYHSQLPPSLNNLREKYKDLRERSDELYSTTVSLRNYLINYLKGYTGKDVYSVNSDNTYSALDDDGYERVYSTEEFKDLPQLKKYNELEKEFYENYYPSLMALEKEFRDHPDNTTSDRVSDVFQVEGNKLREWYKKKGEELSVIPIYGIQDTSKVNAALKDVDLQDVGIMGHSGEILGGIPLEWWNNKLKDAEYRNCILGSCLGESLVPLLPDVKNIYHTIENQWYGVNPSADSLEDALFSTQEKTKIKPIKGRDYNISNKYKTGGIVPKAQEGVKIQADRRNWLQRTNDRIQTAYNKNKPQLLKDFPITDIPGMMVEYVTGHSKDPDAGLAMVNPVGKIGKAVKVHQAAGKFKAKEKGINFVKNWIEHPESQKRINEITDLSYAETFNQALKETIKGNPTYKPSFILDWLKDEASSLGVGPEFRKSFYILGPESFTTKNLNRGYLIPQSRIVKKEPGVTSRATGISFNDGSFWVARESPRSRITTDAVHEAAHNVTSNLENAKMKKITNDAFGGTNSIKKLKKANPGIAEEISYLTRPTEVYARVMELRKQFGLKPGQIVDKKLGEKIFTKGVLNKTEVSPTFFNLMGAIRQDLPKRGGAWFTDLFNKLPAAVPAGIVGSSMYMNNQNKDKE